jgi:acetophenone carboxylase
VRQSLSKPPVKASFEALVYSVDIDVGGTLTDGIFSDGQRRVCAKVDSTAHDLTVCLFDCLSKGAAQLGFSDLPGFLEHVELLRWSTTITSNVLAELRGPKIGLIVSHGHERNLYGEEGASPALNRLVHERDIIGIENPKGSEILSAIHSLLENGVRRICISLKGALRAPDSELWIKRLIAEQYPDHFLGSVPVLTGTDICQNTDDMTRTHYALINAYTHSALAATLFKAEDELRYSQGYSGAFLISHINGGLAGVAKTRAIDTMESGPILGIYGAAYLASAYALDRVVALDVGGTTAKIGVVQNGRPVFSQVSDLFGIPVRVGLPYLRSIALGGGSVVSYSENCVLLGPESMGAFPGPVCYGLGGEKATLTDAFVAAGLIDPNDFLGGSKRLDVELARGAIASSTADPGKLSLQEAYRHIIDRAYEMVAEVIASTGKQLGQDLSDSVLFAYGGNGGLFACGVAERAGIKDVYLFDLGPVFSAFGSSVSDICHVYERFFHLPFRRGTDVNPLNALIAELRADGMRDLLGEGIKPDQIDCSVEFEVARPGLPNLVLPAPQLQFAGLEDLLRLLDITSATDGWNLELIRLRLRKAMPTPALPSVNGQPRILDAVPTGKRRVDYGSSTGHADLYRWESLLPGSTLRGCAILQSLNTTYLVPEGWVLTVDELGNALLKHNAT